MEIAIKGFIYHKDAEGFEDCFDRYAVNTNHHKFCVSDGVSKSFFPGIWADLLVKDFVATPGKVDIVDTELLRSLQKKWNRKVAEIVNRPNQKYFVRNFFAQGRSAAATFVGLNFFQEYGKLRWEAFALGDSFLFFIPKTVRNLDDDFSQVIYVSSKTDFEFDNFPDFFDSVHKINKGKIKQIKQDLLPGTFLMMTDALSEWFINDKNTAIEEIRSWTSQQRFEQRVIKLRKSHLQNDDSAILIIEVEEDGHLDINYREMNISLFEKLKGNTNYHYDEQFYENEINAIEQKFSTIPDLSIKPTIEKDEVELFNQARDVHIFESEKSKNNQEYLTKRNRPKLKKRGFWEKKVDAVVKMFSSKNYNKDDDEIIENKPGQNDDPFQDVDSITDKF
jgi:hypothetical protein